MSREERKMAQIIASIERMEQETRDGADGGGRSQEPHDASRQGGRGKKGKKAKFSGVKAKAGKRLKVTAVAGGKEPFERKLTPKKRWIQLWSAQLDTIKEKDSGSSSEGTEKDAVETDKVVATSPVAAAKMTPTAPPAMEAVAEKQETAPKVTDKAGLSPKAAATPVPTTEKMEKPAPVPAPVSVVEKKPQEQTEKPKTETPKATSTPKSIAATTTPKAATTLKAATTPKASSAGVAPASSSSELRVKTPLNNESSHLSPPLERNSPTTTASISPSAKVKDSDTPNTNTAAAAAAAAKFSPAAAEQERPVTEKKDLPKREPVAPKLERKISNSSSVGKGEESYRSTSDRQQDRGRKRSLERSDLPMSEEARRRAERRRKRKSNWDVGDPRKGGSPIPDPPISAAAAAANQQSFAKYPPNRPSWRHSQSMMDIKPHFQSAHRSSSFYNSSSSSGTSSGARRGFYHSTSLPQDRSRSAGRSSTRYSYGSSTSSTSGNYR